MGNIHDFKVGFFSGFFFWGGGFNLYSMHYFLLSFVHCIYCTLYFFYRKYLFCPYIVFSAFTICFIPCIVSCSVQSMFHKLYQIYVCTCYILSTTLYFSLSLFLYLSMYILCSFLSYIVSFFAYSVHSIFNDALFLLTQSISCKQYYIISFVSTSNNYLFMSWFIGNRTSCKICLKLSY